MSLRCGICLRLPSLAFVVAWQTQLKEIRLTVLLEHLRPRVLLNLGCIASCQRALGVSVVAPSRSLWLCLFVFADLAKVGLDYVIGSLHMSVMLTTEHIVFLCFFGFRVWCT